MEELFNILSSSARIDKSKRRKRKTPPSDPPPPSNDHDRVVDSTKSRDKTGKRDTSRSKQRQVHQEQMAAFRRSLHIRLSKDSIDVPDAISNFCELRQPPWWTCNDDFRLVWTHVMRTIEAGDWKEPTPIQMQAIPAILERRDVLASAPTGSGKSGAFLIPAVLLSAPTAFKEQEKMKQNDIPIQYTQSRQGHIRTLLLAPSRELAAQLHREVERLGHGRPGGFTALLLSRSNANQVSQAGGHKGLDVLVSTPLRLVEALQQHNLSLERLRLVVLDEADRLLDATDLKDGSSKHTFISQLDTILAALPATAIRALFSATIPPSVQELSDSILRRPVHMTIQPTIGGANPDIHQELLFCGREEGKLLAIRQLVSRGELRPPVLIFCQSQERAQALFAELVYDNLHVDVLHAGRSLSARETAVRNFRMGHTWVLICTDLVARGVDFCSVHLVINYDLPTSGVSYVHRIGRTGRAGRQGRAITFFTEADMENLRAIANVMKQSGCEVPEWMLNIKKTRQKEMRAPRRRPIGTTPVYERAKQRKKRQMIENSKKLMKTEAAQKDR